MPGPEAVDRAIRYSYAQAMLGAVFAASTGGMFLTGFALKLGAGDRMLGLISSLPMLFVVFQFAGAILIERGISRRKLTFRFGLVTPICWFLIALIPLVGTDYARRHISALAMSDHSLQALQFTILIGTLALVTACSQFSNSARGSWVGELIPEEKRGKFFGNTAMCWMIISTVFAIIEGKFLDYITSKGLFAFTALFFFGALFGLIGIFMTLPQPDCPLPEEESKPTVREIARRTVRNRALVALALVHGVWSLTNVANPFFPAYQLRDIGFSFLRLGILNSIWMAGFIIGAPMWGKFVKRFGCKPIIQIGFLAWAPCSFIWLAIPPGAVERATWLLPLPNLVSGLAASALSVGVSTMQYKASQPVGRSVQFAIYSTFVTLAGAPMPILGGWLVSHLQQAGHHIDLRFTFYAAQAFTFIAAYMASRLHEPDAADVKSVALYHLPSRAVGALGIELESVPLYSTLLRKLNLPASTDGTVAENSEA